MLNKINISPGRQKLIIYIFLAAITFAVYWQVNQFDFINMDDDIYVTGNFIIQSGISLEGFRWAFSTTYAEFWHPLTWLSLMLDYQLYGLNAGGYHLTNLILHIMSTLLLFWLFCRMTGAVWKSAFVAALFAIHPLHVQSVAWISERKDALSAFFWMLTLCLYVYYTEKLSIKIYILMLFSFFCALMSKPIVVSLPVIMILLDYWPLKRFSSKKGSLILWQLREKIPFLILSAAFAIITIYAQHNAPYKQFEEHISLGYRITHAPVFFMTYLEKIFWPNYLDIVYPFLDKISLWQVLSAVLLIILISAAVIVTVKRLPYLFVGWLWYIIILFPVIGIIPSGPCLIADHHTYLPSIGVAVMLAWRVPSLIKSKNIRKMILFPTGIVIFAILVVLSWQQCGYWKNSIKLWNHSLQVSKENCSAHHYLALALFEKGKIEEAIYHYTKCIRINSDYIAAYIGRGVAYTALNQYQRAIEDFSETIRLKPDYALGYYNLGIIYTGIGQYQRAIEEYNMAIRLKPDFVLPYINRGVTYLNHGNKELGCFDAQKACELGYCKFLEMSKNKGDCH